MIDKAADASETTTRPDPGPRVRFGIKGRLIGAFAVVAALTVAACLVSYRSFNHVDASFGQIKSQSLPQMDMALTLSREGNEITTLAGSIATANGLQEVDRSAEQVAAREKAISEALDALGSTGADPNAVDRLRASAGELFQSTDKLWDAKTRQFALRDDRTGMIKAALAAHARLAGLIAPLVDSASFDLEVGLTSLPDMSDPAAIGPAVQQLIDVQIAQIQNAWSLRAEANNTIGLFSEVTVAPNADLLITLDDRFTAAAHKVQTALEGMPTEAATEELKKAVHGLLAPGQGERTIFAVRRDEVAAIQEVERLIADNQARERTFAQDLGKLVSAAQDSSGRQIVQSDVTLSNAKLYLVVLAVFSILASIAIAWFYVGNGLLRRLAKIHSSVRALAGGQLDFEIPARERASGDELGEIAKAVEVFRDNARAKLRAEQDAAQQRQVTDEERRRNAAANASVAERQARVVKALGHGLSKLAEGDLTFRLTEAFAEEYRELQENFNSAIAALHDVMGEIVAGADSMRMRSREISDAADALSRRTEKQAASLEETAAALDEATTNVNRTASGAAKAHHIVAVATGDAERSGGVVSSAVNAMSEIERSSRQISQIIGIIDEIAFQTNLLALNAGVEAARAGEAGRGFAVVAQEVRTLAQRSAEAAREIKALIAASSQQVAEGGRLVGETGTVLKRIIAQVSEINTTVAEIAATAQGQASGLGEVNAAVAGMDHVTQQNAAMAEESTAASQTLASEAAELTKLISRFRISAEGADSRRQADPSPVVVQLKNVGQRGKTAVRAAAARVVEEGGWEAF